MSTVAAQSQRNGVDVAAVMTLDAVKAHPEAASPVGVTNRWISAPTTGTTVVPA
jgi:hypothetical protein